MTSTRRPLRDLSQGRFAISFWREFALSWHQRRSLAVDRRDTSAECAGQIPQFMARNCPIPGMSSAQRSQHGRGKRRKWVLRTRRVRTQHLSGRARRNGFHFVSRRNACGAGHSRAQRLGYVPRMRNAVSGESGLARAFQPTLRLHPSQCAAAFLAQFAVRQLKLEASSIGPLAEGTKLAPSAWASQLQLA